MNPPVRIRVMHDFLIDASLRGLNKVDFARAWRAATALHIEGTHTRLWMFS